MAITDSAGIPRDTTVTTDLCIVGGGPSGIALALRLAGSGLRVVLLESGGMQSGGVAQGLNEGTNIGIPYFELHKLRYRGLGGNSNRWGGWCRPLEPLDMETRSWVPLSGWPLRRDELDSYYREAAALCQLESENYGGGEERLPPLYRPPFVGDDVRIVRWQGSPPTKFGIVYHDALAAARHVTVVTDATAVSVLFDEEPRRATGVRVRSMRGNQFDIRSRAVVLCAGALETARLMLASAPGGLGNEHDLVGRHFMEHPHVVTAIIELAPAGERPVRIPALDHGLLGARARLQLLRPTGITKVAYALAEETMRREQLLAFSGHFQTVSPGRGTEAYNAMKLVIGNLRSPRRFLRQVRTGSLPVGIGQLFGEMASDFPVLLHSIYSEALRKPRQLALYTQSEQVPNPDSRVTLDPERPDALGLPRVRLDWRLTRLDKQSIMRSQAIIGERFMRHGVGRLVPTDAFRDDGPEWGAGLKGGKHNLGTARMAEDARHGVVDRNQGVHTVAELYVGDSSVFPTGGFANPMLTTVALALRLGDYLRATYS